ncbi:MAG: metallophosphoesterase [Gammaproteobacteria bacterium]|nr:metallophosphoesterase [Gammaproteobacteria bacterium]
MKTFLSAWLLAGLLAFFLPATAGASALVDGPYVFKDEAGYTIKWVCNGEPQQLAGLPHADLAAWRACGLQLPAIRREHPPADHDIQGVQRFAALSDIHGQFHLFKRLLRSNGVIDAENRWAFGDGQLLIAGDVMDRGPAVTEALWFLYDLARQASAAGGGVQLVLGNHEVMVMRDDRRYLHDSYIRVEQLLGETMTELYAPGSVLGDWLRSRPIMMRVNDNLLMHAGVPPGVAEAGIALPDINTAMRQLLLAGSGGDARMADDWLDGGGGPVWYRGHAGKDGISEAELDAQLAHFGVKRLIGGHNSFDRISVYFGGRVLQVDSSIKLGGERGELLLWDEEKGFRRAGLDGVERPL